MLLVTSNISIMSLVYVNVVTSNINVVTSNKVIVIVVVLV